MALERIKDSGPFFAVDMIDPEYSCIGTPEWSGKLEGDDERCACCGSKLSWRVVILSESTGKYFIMGRTCAHKAGMVKGVTEAERKMEMRVMSLLASGSDFGAWLDSQPHPMGWRGKTRRDDVHYCGSRDIKVVLKAHAEYLAAKPAWDDAKAAKQAMADGFEARLDAIPGFRVWVGKEKHPKGWWGKRLVDDLRYWTCERGDASPLEAAEAAFRATPACAKAAKKAAKETAAATKE